MYIAIIHVLITQLLLLYSYHIIMIFHMFMCVNLRIELSSIATLRIQSQLTYNYTSPPPNLHFGNKGS